MKYSESRAKRLKTFSVPSLSFSSRSRCLAQFISTPPGTFLRHASRETESPNVDIIVIFHEGAANRASDPLVNSTNRGWKCDGMLRMPSGRRGGTRSAQAGVEVFAVL